MRVTTGLADRLRSETRALHAEAERSPFMAALLRGRMERPGYVALLRNLAAIYAVLEPALAHHASHPALAPMRLAALGRSEALRADIALLDFTAEPAPLATTTGTYVSRLQELDSVRPDLLLAHAYVRYLGDLSGGQLLRRVVARSPALAGSRAIAFYDFGTDAQAAALAREFRAGLESAAVADAGEVVDEAVLSFRWHRRLFDELADAHGIVAEGPEKVST